MTILFHYLSLLNIFDGIITFVGLENSLISELNPIMDKLYQMSPMLFLFSKLSLSIFLYLFIFFKKVPTSKPSAALTYFASGTYTLLFVLHCYWIMELAL